MQLNLDFTAQELAVTHGASAIAVHVLIDGELVSHVQTIDSRDQ